jgi:uncharacterized membrane protein (DUF106 family)
MINAMDNYTMVISIAGFALILLLVALIIIFEKIQKEFVKDYEQLQILKDWYEKVSEEASRSYIIEIVEKRGYEVINQLDKLNSNFIEIQEKQKKLQEEQQKLHRNLLEEHKLLNEYFENYS